MTHSYLLCHTTPATNVPAILREGLLPELARGKLKAVWLHTRRKTPWAAARVARRHRTPKAALVVITLYVSRRFLCRHNRGHWYTACRVLPDWVVSVRPLCLGGRP